MYLPHQLYHTIPVSLPLIKAPYFSQTVPVAQTVLCSEGRVSFVFMLFYPGPNIGPHAQQIHASVAELTLRDML